jgi:hypothetical protein
MDVVYLKGREKREEKWMQNCGNDAKKKFVAASNRDACWYFKWRERERERESCSKQWVMMGSKCASEVASI